LFRSFSGLKAEAAYWLLNLITKVLVRHDFEVRVLTGAEEHEVMDNVTFIHEPRLRASNKIFDLLDTTTNLYTWISLLSILLVNS